MKEYIAERRRHLRVNKGLPVKIKGLNFDSVSETINISRSGAYCHVDKYIPPMTKLGILLLVSMQDKKKTAMKKIQCQGVVVRTEECQDGGYNIAVFFSEISEPDAQKIAKYVGNNAPQK